MEIELMAARKGENLPLSTPVGMMVDLRDVQKMTYIVMEEGMASGEPSVLILVESDKLPIHYVMATSLDKFLTAASGLASLAENRWGWERPKGHATLMPPSKEEAKLLLEQIKKELEEWVDGD